MRTILFKTTFLLLAALSFSTPLFSQNQDDIRASIFSQTEKLLAKVQSEQANLLAPDAFKKAMNRYNRALDDFKEGKNLKDIKNKLTEVRTLLNKCLETAKIGKITFASTLKAREDALKANAPEYAPALFDDAESAFLSAAKKLEKGDIKGAKKRLPQIDNNYRNAELSAIKTSIIGNVRNLMKEAKNVEANKYTPIIYANAQKLLNEAEALLNNSRTSQSGAKEKAEAAEIEAKHAIALTRQIKWLKKNPKEWENFILDREILIEDIARELGYKAIFDEGMEKPLKEIKKVVSTLQREKRELLQEVAEKDKEIQRLNQELQSYLEKEQGLQAQLQEKQYKLELKKRREELIRSVENMFTSKEAIVLRKGDDLILRLIGLTFPSGKAIIVPEYFGLLATVQRAIRKFPNATLTIEGHTDSRGDARYNENLSYERALAVKKYLLANMGLDESRITAVGYGETRPIASNETRAGRAKNRRIDIVITFAKDAL